MIVDCFIILISITLAGVLQECLPMLCGCEENAHYALIVDQMFVIGAVMLKKRIKSDCLDLRF